MDEKIAISAESHIQISYMAKYINYICDICAHVCLTHIQIHVWYILMTNMYILYVKYISKHSKNVSYKIHLFFQMYIYMENTCLMLNVNICFGDMLKNIHHLK